MKRFPDKYGTIDIRDLIIAVGRKYGEIERLKACERVKAGPDYIKRVEDFYAFCYKDGILRF